MLARWKRDLFPRDRSISGDPKTRLHTPRVRLHVGFYCAVRCTRASLTNACDFRGRVPTPGCCRSLMHGCGPRLQAHTSPVVRHTLATLLVYEPLKWPKSICCSSVFKCQTATRLRNRLCLSWSCTPFTQYQFRHGQNKSSFICLGQYKLKVTADS